jgi:hypothetical protein
VKKASTDSVPLKNVLVPYSRRSRQWPWLMPTIRACHFEVNTMNLAIWLPSTFPLGLIGLGLCYAFLVDCEKV